jgi:hypothetical protein
MRRLIWLLGVSLGICLHTDPVGAQVGRAAGAIDGVVSDSSLVPLAGVEVTILRTSIRAFTGENGRFRITSIPSGTYLLAVRHLGFRPISQLVGVVDGDTLRLSILMEKMSQSLDTIRVSGNGDPTGFSWRRGLGVGQFIISADIDRENPRTTTSLIRTRDAMRYASDNNGQPFVTMAAGPGKICSPFIFLDGFPIQGGSRLGLDWALHPEEIGGVEIYVNPSQVPAQFRGFPHELKDCGVVVFWTRDRLGIPPKGQVGPP